MASVKKVVKSKGAGGSQEMAVMVLVVFK